MNRHQSFQRYFGTLIASVGLLLLAGNAHAQAHEKTVSIPSDTLEGKIRGLLLWGAHQGTLDPNTSVTDALTKFGQSFRKVVRVMPGYYKYSTGERDPDGESPETWATLKTTRSAVKRNEGRPDAWVTVKDLTASTHQTFPVDMTMDGVTHRLSDGDYALNIKQTTTRNFGLRGRLYGLQEIEVTADVSVAGQPKQTISFKATRRPWTSRIPFTKPKLSGITVTP